MHSLPDHVCSADTDEGELSKCDAEPGCVKRVKTSLTMTTSLAVSRLSAAGQLAAKS